MGVPFLPCLLDIASFAFGSAYSGAISVSGILITQVTSYVGSPAVVVAGAATLGGSIGGPIDVLVDDPFSEGNRSGFNFRVTFSSF